MENAQAIIPMEEYNKLKERSKQWEQNEKYLKRTEEEIAKFDAWKLNNHIYTQQRVAWKRREAWLEANIEDLSKQLNPLYTALPTLLRKYNYKLKNVFGIKFIIKL